MAEIVLVSNDDIIIIIIIIIAAAAADTITSVMQIILHNLYTIIH